MNTSMVKIKKGSVFVYRIFDIAEEVNISRVEELLENPLGQKTFKVPKYIDRGIVMKSRPVAFRMNDVRLDLSCGTYTADVIVKIRDYGVLSFVYEIVIPPGTNWTELLALASDLEEGSEIDLVAVKQAKDVAERINHCLKQPNTWTAFEDYIIYFIEEFEGDTSAQNIVERADVASLILAEDDCVISEKTRESILLPANIFQYSARDLAIVEWNAALVVEPSGEHEIPDILEFAVTHLLEMRYYDDLLDERLAVLYDSIEKIRGTTRLSGKFDQLYQEASSRYIEFSEFTERVENSLKVVGDFYLATVYRAATRKFRLADWQQNVTRKMNLLAQVSSLLQGEVNIRRSHWMEITIICLILFEIISALVQLKINLN